ncbi:U1 small nuclear ribonucleoprotein A [Tritrichomonas foetus]|uniref:U1 small nuclear ribonucleoprotein A n=1 Tax=Tritrichomonas foetus TaxID=1144522 RepID=A0A1J4J729_9EUKA|nr:U1 small nuclear ribonucleoprotein A [Tritrichomonas foetus]|eukprot:OHS94007.1 U1 small nuclear ribonucleoprotein A [Tritrichomonas foetus]
MSTASLTLYVNNICDKIGILELKRTLFSIFSNYGTILEINAHKGLKRRGQAWITFDNVKDASEAKNMLDRYYLFDRPISVKFAKVKSHVTQKVSGAWNPYGRKHECISDLEAKQLTNGAIPKYYDFDMESNDEERSIVFPDAPKSDEASEKKTAVTVPTIDLIPPNKVLFVQNLFASAEETNMTLEMLFGQYRGFKEARAVPTKPDIAFVEFETAEQATMALDGLNGTEIDANQHMLIQYAKQ